MTGCITAWYGNCTALDCIALQRVLWTAQYITGARLPAIQDLYISQCEMKARKTVKDSSHPSHRLFSSLPHGKRYQSIKSGTNRTLNSFYPQVTRLLKYLTKWLLTICIDPSIFCFALDNAHSLWAHTHTHTLTVPTRTLTYYHNLRCCSVYRIS